MSQIISIILMLYTLINSSPLAAEENQYLIPFELQDQFGNTYTKEDLADKILVLIGSDKGGSKFNRIWAKEIYQAIEGKTGMKQVQFLGLAHLEGVPFFLKGFVKSKFPKNKNEYILLDWQGRFAEKYNFTRDHSNILIFDRDQRLVLQDSVTELVEDKLTQFVSTISILINSTT